jgi:hypothetical protein
MLSFFTYIRNHRISFKAIIKQTIYYIKNKLTFINVGDFAPFL